MSHEGFTPGPWKIYRASNGSLLGIGDADAGGVTDYQGGFWSDGEERRANIHLVAAAPDLLVALSNLMERLEDVGLTADEDQEPAMVAARAAITKATGQTNMPHKMVERVKSALNGACKVGENISFDALARAAIEASHAPELLAALQHILDGSLSLPRFAEAEGRAAIAKATGQTAMSHEMGDK
jgi:hypothetical protein